MTREEHIKRLEASIAYWDRLIPVEMLKTEKRTHFSVELREDLRFALAALSGWVLLTRETAPTEPDETPFLVYMEGWFERPYDAVRVWTAGEIRYTPEEVIAYMPLPTLPETAGAEGTKTPGEDV